MGFNRWINSLIVTSSFVIPLMYFISLFESISLILMLLTLSYSKAIKGLGNECFMIYWHYSIAFTISIFILLMSLLSKSLNLLSFATFDNIYDASLKIECYFIFSLLVLATFHFFLKSLLKTKKSSEVGSISFASLTHYFSNSS